MAFFTGEAGIPDTQICCQLLQLTIQIALAGQAVLRVVSQYELNYWRASLT